MLLGPDRQPLKTADGSFLRVDVAEALSNAVPGCTPMAIPAPDVLAVDFDEPDNPRQVRRFDVLQDELAAAGYVPVITASGRTGHRHLWCLIEDATDHERLTKLGKGLNLSVRNGQAMRLPLAPHAEGLPVSLISPETPEGALRAVRRTVPTPPLPIPVPRQAFGLHLVGKPAPSRPPRPLGARPAKALRDGAQAGGYPTRHGADLGIALSAVQAGWTFEQLQAAYADASNRGGEKYRELEHRGPDYLRQTWAKAQLTAATQPSAPDPTAATELLAAWRIEALGQPWPGRSGATDLALYLAFVNAGLTAPQATLTPALSRTEMADAIGQWLSTVNRSLGRLTAAGVVKEHEKGNQKNRTRWRILPPPLTGVAGPLGSQLGGQLLSGPTTPVDPAHDLFTAGGLQHNGWHLLSVLNPTEEFTAATLAAMTGRDAKTVRRYLSAFVKLALALPSGDGYLRVAQPDLDAAAGVLGVTGAAATRAAAGAAKRAAWTTHRAQVAAAVAKATGFDPATGEVHD
jgi:hypothetical protein